MSILSGMSDFVGLDIGSTGVRAVQLRGSGTIKSLVRYGQIQLPGTVGVSDADLDRRKVAEAIKALFSQAKLSTKRVVVNLPSSKVFITVIEMDKMSPADLAKTIRYQADSFIPTPLEESKISWALLGDSSSKANKVEILLSSANNAYVTQRTELLESIGLKVLAIEPDGVALARSMIAVNTPAPTMAVDVGSNSTDLVIAVNNAPRLVRTVPIGVSQIVRAVMQNLGLDEAQAEQFVFKFGLGEDKLEGKIYSSIVGVTDSLINEFDKSIKFFSSRYPSMKIDRVIVTGGASSIPQMPLYVANKLGIGVEIGNAWRNVNSPAAAENELMAVANHFAVAAGLAERNI